MPLYEYQCLSCGQHFELLVRGSEKPACPSCRGVDLQQLLSLFAVSTESTRQSSLKLARERRSKVTRDKQIAYEEQVRNHEH